MNAFASPFGVNAHVPSVEAIRHMAECGIKWARIDVCWRNINPSPSEPHKWHVYDRVFGECKARKIKVLASIADPPGWCSPWGDEWERFVFGLVSRYRAGSYVAAWSVWNEPNLERFWKYGRDKFIRKTYLPGVLMIRKADPGAYVVGPDLAHLTSAQWDVWLAEIVRAAGPLLAALAHHCYPARSSADNLIVRLSDGERWPWASPALLDVLAWVGWTGPVWLTETGAPDDDPNFYRRVGSEMFGPRRSRVPEVVKVFPYMLHDDPREPGKWGLLTAEPELQRKRSFYAYSDIIKAYEATHV